jgi:hypothetical protein
MRHVKEPSNKRVLEFAVAQDAIGAQLLNWLRGVVALTFGANRREHNHSTVRPSQLAVHPLVISRASTPSRL